MNATIRSRITGTGSYTPENVMTNFDFEKTLDTSDKWIMERTGIKERRIAPKEIVTSDMAVSALIQALDMAGKSADDLDMIVCGTVTPDTHLPATAAFVQRKIGAKNNCPSFDLSAACAGFIYGLAVADSFIRSGDAKTIAVVGTEMLTRFMNLEDRNTCILFGDAAGAVILEADRSDRGILSTHLFTDGSLTDILTIPAGGAALPASEMTVKEKLHCIKMEGREVFRVAVRNLTSAALTALQKNNLSADQIDLVVAHQANIRILDGVSNRVKIPMSKFILNIEHYGNTSSASIPLALDEAVRADKIKEGDKLLMIALGGGISWGSSLIVW